MPGYNSQRRGTGRTLPKLIVSFCVLFVCKCVLYYRHWVSARWQITNMSIKISNKSLQMNPSREPGEHIALSYLLFLGRYICVPFHIHTLGFLTPAYECLLCYVTYRSTPCHSVRTRALRVQKLKVCLFLFHVMTAYVRGIAPPILNLGARWR